MSSFYYSMEQIKALRAEVLKRNLSRPAYFDKLTDEDLHRICNGCGPDWMSKRGRDFLTKRYEVFGPCIMIHDVEYEYSDHSKEKFKEANQRLYDNDRAIVAADYSWWRPLLKSQQYFRAWEMYVACKDLGWSAWTDGTPQSPPEV